MGYYSVARPGNIAFSDWLTTPSVDRTRVKIRRFDYFGHSGQDGNTGLDAFFLQFGWTNKKGAVAEGEVVLTSDDLDKHLTQNIVAPDSFAKLWGCHATRTMAPTFATVFDTVEACAEFVTYDPILKGDGMPTPLDPNHPFVTFKR